MELYVFEEKIQSWKGKTIIAKAETSAFEFEPDWWDCKPLSNWPPVFRFFVESDAPLLDVYFTGSELQLYSDKLIDILSNFSVEGESFLAEVTFLASRKTTESDYRVYHLLSSHSVIDLTRSDFAADGSVKKLVPFIGIDGVPPMFRSVEREQFVLVRQDLKTALEEAGITGCTFTALSDFKTGIYRTL